jgi:beta-N-acetylhexosaminidase
MTLEELVGQTLVFGIPGTRVTRNDVRLFQETHAGGIIFYRINFESPAQIRKLITDMESALGRRLLVTVDHEGGRVVMFRDGVTIFPDSLAFGNSGDLAAARRQGEIEARELRRLGVDVNLAPVVDILTKTFSPNIGIRSYGTDPDRVSDMAAARIAAMQKNGVSACAKHFPGKGHSPLDAHLSLPVIPSTWKEMRRVHIKPFLKAMDAGVDMSMSSHPLYPKLDPTPKTPASFSRRLIRNYLREELGFQGVISSDDLEMGAIKDLCPVGRAAVLTAKAGHDLLLSCHDAASQREVYRSLVEAYRSGELSLADLEASVERIRRLKAKRPRRFAPGAPRPEPGGARLAYQIATAGLRVKGPHRSLPITRRNGRVAVIFPRLSDFANKIMIERPLEDEKSFLRERLPRGLDAEIHVLPVDPSREDIRPAVQAARAADAAVYFCFDAHLHPGGRRLLDALQNAVRRFVLVLLRDPYDEAFAKPSTVVVTSFGFRVCQIQACIAKIFA